MKPTRGQRRYYRNLAFQNELKKSTWMNLDDPKVWFDNWHLHFDWKGFGNNSFKRRKPHLDKLFRHFDLLQKETEKLKVGFQLYVVLYDYDSYNDALYLNTPNPNNCEFPLAFPNLGYESTLTNKLLQKYIDDLQGFEKLYRVEDQPCCYLFKKGIGRPLQLTAANTG